MGGQSQVAGWDTLDGITAQVEAVPGLTPQQRIDTAAGIHRAIDNVADVNAKLALVGKVKGIVEGSAQGGIGGLFHAALAAVGVRV